MSTPAVRVLPGPDELAAAAADEVVAALRARVRDDGVAHVALSGGSTPRALFQQLVRRPSDVPWARVHVWWGDERCVPPDDPASNHHLAREHLLRPLGAQGPPAAQVHRIRGEDPPRRAAAAYERELERVLGPRGALDLVLLGLGTDGHTASLFPGEPALEERERLVATSRAPVPPHERVTLTYPALAAARRALFLVAGADKAGPLRRVLDARGAGAGAPPAARVSLRSGELLWMVDRAAARELGNV